MRGLALGAALALAAMGVAFACSVPPADIGPTADTGPEVQTSDAPRDALPRGDGGPPSLVSLEVIGVTLLPPFAPDVHDYAVRCGPGGNDFSVRMVASPGAESQLVLPRASHLAPSQTVDTRVEEGAAIVASASNASGTVSTWIRCLPHDFPALAMTRAPGAPAPPPGYYLVGDTWLLPGDSAGYAMVLTPQGAPIWFARQAGLGVFDVDLVLPGAISFRASYTAETFSLVQPFQVDHLSPPTESRISPAGYAPDEHELQVLPGGHDVLLSHPVKGGVDLTGLSLPLGDGGTVPLGPGSFVQDCVVVEVDGTGDVVWTWRASDHFDPRVDTTSVAYAFSRADGVDASGGAPVYDVFHCNAVDVEPGTANLLVSARAMSSVFLVARPSGQVVWKMGGAPASMDGARYVPVGDPFVMQHDARFGADWSAAACGGRGTITLFDDETGTTSVARAAVYDVVVGAGGDDGGACGEGGAAGATLAWQSRGEASSGAAGSFRILADGSRVIGWGFASAPNPVMTEVDATGHALLSFDFPDGHASYRALKVPLSAVDADTLRRAF